MAFKEFMRIAKYRKWNSMRVERDRERYSLYLARWDELENNEMMFPTSSVHT